MKVTLFFINASVNVNKLLFGEMKLAEREREKHAFQMSKQMGKKQCSCFDPFGLVYASL